MAELSPMREVVSMHPLLHLDGGEREAVFAAGDQTYGEFRLTLLWLAVKGVLRKRDDMDTQLAECRAHQAGLEQSIVETNGALRDADRQQAAALVQRRLDMQASLKYQDHEEFTLVRELQKMAILVDKYYNEMLALTTSEH
nr:uncharacterized protein LOC107281192 [Oryza sativa Japonica Group]XP_025881892.1 uncharacterized protein LOC107281192 [Oryza sativa Japonica Group]XP_025881893.1 uncharacterized protein LOC107281192 [Oryza sativa Japonica Group]XP_025881894.1 uncharacterized protein LOC107281192 [Oryza sativa Japonica Group]